MAQEVTGDCCELFRRHARKNGMHELTRAYTTATTVVIMDLPIDWSRLVIYEGRDLKYL